MVLSFVIAAAVTAVALQLMPAQWRARAAIIMPIEDRSSGAFALFEKQSSPVEYYLGILDSYPARVQLAKAANLKTDELDDSYILQASPEESQVRIVAQNKSKQVALQMVQAALDHLHTTVNTTVASMASKEAEFLQLALLERERDLASAEVRLVDFARSAKSTLTPDNPLSSVTAVARQRELGIALKRKEEEIKAARAQALRRAEPSAEIPLGIPAIEEWRKRVEAMEYDLNLKRISLGEQAPEVAMLTKSLAITRESLRTSVQGYLKANSLSLSDNLAQLEAERQVLAWELETVDRIAKTAPSEAAKYSTLLRNVQSITQSIASLRAQFESARVRAEVERSRWSLLTPPYIEEKPVSRRTVLNSILGGLLGASLVGLFVLARRKKASG